MQQFLQRTTQASMPTSVHPCSSIPSAPRCLLTASTPGLEQRQVELSTTIASVASTRSRSSRTHPASNIPLPVSTCKQLVVKGAGQRGDRDGFSGPCRTTRRIQQRWSAALHRCRERSRLLPSDVLRTSEDELESGGPPLRHRAQGEEGSTAEESHSLARALARNPCVLL